MLVATAADNRVTDHQGERRDEFSEFARRLSSIATEEDYGAQLLTPLKARTGTAALA
jgi:hypothetical protein